MFTFPSGYHKNTACQLRIFSLSNFAIFFWEFSKVFDVHSRRVHCQLQCSKPIKLHSLPSLSLSLSLSLYAVASTHQFTPASKCCYMQGTQNIIFLPQALSLSLSLSLSLTLSNSLLLALSICSNSYTSVHPPPINISEIIFKFATSLDQNKCLNQIKWTINTCLPIFELPRV